MPCVGGAVQGRRGGWDGDEQTAQRCAGPGSDGRSAAPAVAGASAQSGVWDAVSGSLSSSGADIRPANYRAFTLDEARCVRPGVGAEGGCGRAGEQLGRALGAQAGRRLRALRGLRGADHGGQAGRQAPGHQDLGGPRRRRPHGDDPRRHHQARLPRLGALDATAPTSSTRTTSATTRVYVSYFARDLSDDERFVEQEVDELAPQVEAADGARRPRGPAAHLPARADHGPELRHLPRRRRQRDRGQGHADQPRHPDLRGRVGDPDGPDRRQRQAQPRHRRRSPTSANGPCGAAPCLPDVELVRRGARPQPLRDRPDHRRERLRHRPHRDGQRGRRRRQRRRRRQQQGARLHRPGHADRRLLRRRLRGARDGPPVLRHRTPSTASWAAAAATAAARARSSPAPAPRSWPTPASAAATTSSRTATRTGSRRATTRS